MRQNSRQKQQVAIRKITGRAILSKDTGCAVNIRLVSRMASKSLVRFCLQEHPEYTLTPHKGNNNYFCKKLGQRALNR